MATPPDRRVDELRQRLRSLGYLDAGVDRFVLAPARRTRTPAVLALRSSLRIGLLAAFLLGPATAVGLAARLPGLVTGPRDAAIAAAYLGLLFGASLAALSFVAALLAAWLTRAVPRLARRARPLSLAAGGLVAACSLAYLTLWWGTAGGAWTAPAWTALALAVAAAISLLLGHTVVITAMAATMAGPGADAIEPGVPGASWKTSAVAGGIAFAGAAALLLATAGAAAPAAAPPPLAVRSPGFRTVVLAIDGFDAQLHAPVTPFAGARAQLSAEDSRDPARLWTTVATGVGVERHGVDALEARQVAGLDGRLASRATGRVIGAATDVLRLTRPAAASTFERRAKAFWEVAEQAGLRTAVVNWWATWPVPAASGIVLSDRAVLRLERGGPLDAEIGPPDLYPALQGRWPSLQAAARARASGHFADVAAAEHRAVLQRSGQLDASVLELAKVIDAGRSLDLLVVYLPGLDIAQHALIGAGGGVSPSELNARLAALERYYGFLDRLIAEALAGADAGGRQVFAVALPGRLHGGGGMLWADGDAVNRAADVKGAIVDVAPTILHAMGVPVARDLEGQVITGLFTPASLARHPVRGVDTYGERGAGAAARGGAPLDQEMIDRLRSLGYVR